jgi:hypothetical protein
MHQPSRRSFVLIRISNRDKETRRVQQHRRFERLEQESDPKREKVCVRRITGLYAGIRIYLNLGQALLRDEVHPEFEHPHRHCVSVTASQTHTRGIRTQRLWSLSNNRDDVVTCATRTLDKIADSPLGMPEYYPQLLNFQSHLVRHYRVRILINVTACWPKLRYGQITRSANYE